MRRVAFFAAAALIALGGCSLAGRQARMNETTKAQVEGLLSEVEMYLNSAGQGKGFVQRMAELGERARKQRTEEAQSYIQHALDKCYEAYALEPRWAPTNHAIAVCELSLGNSDKAIEFARRTLYLDGEREEAWILIGSAHMQKARNAQDAQDAAKAKKEYREAINAFTTFIQKRPEHISVPYLETTIEIIKEEIDKLN